MKEIFFINKKWRQVRERFISEEVSLHGQDY